MALGGLLPRLGRRGRAGRLAEVERSLGLRFRRPELLEEALTHRSYANEQGLEVNYERLEFLGDSVLGLLASEWLFRRYTDLPEGRLSAMKSRMVNGAVLAEHAERLGLGEALRLGVGEARSGGRTKSSLLADALEAVLGAIFLDRGLEAARRLAEELFRSSLQGEDPEQSGDAKTRLQELAQADGLALPVYRLVGEEGPDHRKRFTVECRLADRASAVAEGPTKKLAEQRAAAAVVAELATD